MTDEMWSRAILLVSASQFSQIAKLVPPVIRHEFSQTQSEQHLHFVRQLGRSLAAQNQYEQHESGLHWLEMVATNDWGYVGVPIHEILEDLTRLGSGVPLSDTQDNFPAIPDDVMLQVAPGADIANQPPDMLVTVNGAAGGQRQVERKSYVTPGDWIIVKAESLPFFVGALMDWDDENHKGYVRWLHPQESTQELFKVGRKRKITDIFGSWTWADELQLDKLHVLPPVKRLSRIGHFLCCHLMIPRVCLFFWIGFVWLPPCGNLRVKAQDILEWDFELEGMSADEVPFAILDSLMDNHGMDFTALKFSATPRGTRFRTHRLMP